MNKGQTVRALLSSDHFPLASYQARMPSIDAVRAALPGLSSQIPKDATIVVCGGTSGIGEAMARKLVSLADKPDVHLVGRNAAAADAIIADLKRDKPEGRYAFHA